MNLQVKARYIFELGADEYNTIRKALSKQNNDESLKLLSALDSSQRPQLDKLIKTFTTVITAVAKDMEANDE